MKATTKLAAAIAAALFALPLAASAQDAEDEGGFSWNAAITSDYVFRGVSQTDEEPALQLGADYTWAGGFYVGAWASNVDFGAGGPDVELDVFLGWGTDLSDEWALDLMLNRYTYHGESNGYGDGDYNELIGSLSWNETITLSVGYTNDVYNLGENGWYYAVAGSWGIGNEFTLDAGIGRNLFDDATGVEDYTDFSIGVSRDFGPMNAALGVYATDSSGRDYFGDTADNRVVLTLSFGG